jgi:PilZ domain
MTKCSIRSCNEAAIAGFAELIEVSSISFPRRTMPGGTRYWCGKHECLSLELQGKLGQAIDLWVAPGTPCAVDVNCGGLSAIQAGVVSTQGTRQTADPMGRNESTGGKNTLGREKRRQERFPVDGPAEVVVADAGIVFRGKTHDLSQRGCYIKSTAYLSAGVGAEVEVRFSVSDVHFRAPARVRLVKPGKGAGFEFLRVEQNVQKDLNSLIERLSCPMPEPPEVPTGAAFDDLQ